VKESSRSESASEPGRAPEQRPGGQPADPARQEQVIQRSPFASHTDEHQAVTTAQSAGGLSAGVPEGGPMTTPERQHFELARGIKPRVRRPFEPRARTETSARDEAIND
jgi:hypothetical protein